MRWPAWPFSRCCGRALRPACSCWRPFSGSAVRPARRRWAQRSASPSPSPSALGRLYIGGVKLNLSRFFRITRAFPDSRRRWAGGDLAAHSARGRLAGRRPAADGRSFLARGARALCIQVALITGVLGISARLRAASKCSAGSPSSCPISLCSSTGRSAWLRRPSAASPAVPAGGGRARGNARARALAVLYPTRRIHDCRQTRRSSPRARRANRSETIGTSTPASAGAPPRS